MNFTMEILNSMLGNIAKHERGKKGGGRYWNLLQELLESGAIQSVHKNETMNKEE